MDTPLSIWEKKSEIALKNINELKYDKKIKILVGSATCENAAGSTQVYTKFNELLGDNKEVYLGITGCTGRCSEEPIVQVTLGTENPVIYSNVSQDDVIKIVNEHIKQNNIVQTLLLKN